MTQQLPIPNQNNIIVTNHALRQLARGDAGRQQGTISTEDQAILAMILPEICNELLERRAAALTITTNAFRTPNRLAAARALIRSDETVFGPRLADACRTIIQHSQIASERAAAIDVLAQIKQAA